jgi:transcriptional regulator with XRE-family HTH domain
MYDVFRRLMEAKGVRLADVCRATGIAPQTLNAWKNGKYTPKADKLQKIADYFGVPLEYLQTGDIGEGFFLNPETARTAQEIAESRELSLLFSAARDASPEDLMTTYNVLLALKKKERHDD